MEGVNERQVSGVDGSIPNGDNGDDCRLAAVGAIPAIPMNHEITARDF